MLSKIKNPIDEMDQKKENKKSIYTNIKDSTYFSKLLLGIQTFDHMTVFLESHQGTIFFPTDKINDACNLFYASSLQLDALFLLIRCAVNYYDSIVRSLSQTISENISMFPTENLPPELLECVTSPNFYKYFAEEIIKKYSNEINLETYTKYFLETFKYSFKYGLLSSELDGTKIIQYLIDNVKILQQFIKIAYEKISEEVNKILPSGIEILSLCSKSYLDTNEKNTLTNFIRSFSGLEIDFQNDKFLSEFYEYVREEELDTFWTENTNESSFNNLCYYGTNYGKENPETRKKMANSRLEPYGLEIYSCNHYQYMHNFVSCLMEHNLISNEEELTKIIGNILVMERDTPGYTNKYDEITLYNHFVLTSIANDVKISYEDFIKRIILDKRLPFDYPIEIIFRIISRVFNIIINIYSYDLHLITIDNTIETINCRMISVYQYSFDEYYNTITRGESFSPIQEKPEQLKIESKYYTVTNNLEDIVEI